VAEITVRQALNDAMREEMRRDETVIVLGCDVAIRGNPFGVTRGLLQEFGEKRVIDTPISEAAFTGTGIGAAAMGLRPIVEILYSDWITLPMDHNTHSPWRHGFITYPVSRLSHHLPLTM